METKDIFQLRYYKFNKQLLSVVGLWPFQTDFKGRLILTVNAFIGITQLLTEMFGVITLWGDLDDVFECLTPLLTNAVCIIKLINSIWNNNKMQLLVRRMQRNWDSLKTTAEKEILEKYAENGRKLTRFYSNCMFVIGLTFMSVPIVQRIHNANNTVTRPEELQFRAEYFVDQNKYYYPILLHGSLSIYIFITLVAAVETMFFAQIEHACGLLSALGYRLQNAMGKRGDAQLLTAQAQDEAYENIIYCIEKHQQAIEFVDLLESSYSKAFLGQLFLNMVVMSLTVIQVTADTADFHSIIRFGVYVTAQLMHLFFESWRAEAIIEHTSKIHEIAYDSEWYRCSTRCRKLIWVILLRSNVFSVLTAGKVIVMSLASFGAVVRTSMSYYMMLQSFA